MASKNELQNGASINSDHVLGAQFFTSQHFCFWISEWKHHLEALVSLHCSKYASLQRGSVVKRVNAWPRPLITRSTVCSLYKSHPLFKDGNIVLKVGLTFRQIRYIKMFCFSQHFFSDGKKKTLDYSLWFL